MAPSVSVSIAVARFGPDVGRQRERRVDLGRDVLGDRQRWRIDDEADADDVELELGEGLLLGGERHARRRRDGHRESDEAEMWRAHH